MELCPMCEKIKTIRNNQGKEYFNDLCLKCKLIYLINKIHKTRVENKRIVR